VTGGGVVAIITAMYSNDTAPPPARWSAGLLTFVLAHFGHHMGTATLFPLLPMIRDDFGLDYFQSGVLISAFSLTYGFAQLPIAAVAERVGKRRVLALGLAGTGLGCLAAALSGSYLYLALSMVVMGIAGSSYHAPASALLSQIAGKRGRGRSLGMHVIGGSAGLMAAPMMAILVANVTGSWRNSFLAASLPVFAAGVLVWVLLRSQEESSAREVAREAVAPVRFFMLFRLLGLLVVVALLIQLLVSAMTSYLPLFLVDAHGVSSDISGLMLAVIYGAGAVTAPLGGALSDRIGRKPIVLLCVVLTGPAILLITMLPFGPLMIAALIFYGGVITVRLPVMEAHIADVIPASQRAVVLAGFYFVSQETAGIFTPVLGLVIDQMGLFVGFQLLAGMALGISLLVLLLWKKV
jgi:MFS transporter, FSR family, fosmidomycin resistance protein